MDIKQLFNEVLDQKEWSEKEKTSREYKEWLKRQEAIEERRKKKIEPKKENENQNEPIVKGDVK
jgi:hypothetical protein